MSMRSRGPGKLSLHNSWAHRPITIS
ncbi:hypothetical protein RHECNPAF_25300121 [Rhizobium etli CNPAF512]|nr:hypothetical protein RHECNPAF_25300121 [Rhizobium etli CNPAF512]